MVSLKDIATKCGVSISTVSKALNDARDVGEKTKEFITTTAKSMGYLPNSSARALKTNRTYNIGVLFIDGSHSGLRHDYFANVLDSFKRTAESKGYDITFINADKNRKNKMTYKEHCMYRGFDGVVIACVDYEDKEVNELISSKIPLVTIDHVFKNRSSVSSNNAKGMKDLLTYAVKMGHRRIAYIHGDRSEVTMDRLGSFVKLANELDIPIPDEYIKEAPYRNIEVAAQKTEELMKLKKRPTCIFYPDDHSAVGGINVIKRMGLSIPEDISVIGYDGAGITNKIAPCLTTLCQDTEEIGRLAAEKLIGHIERTGKEVKEPVEHKVVDGELFKGETVKFLKLNS